MAVTKAKKKVVKKVSHGIAHVVATNNNTRITITDQSGAVLTWATAGANNFKGAKKSTPYAATVVADAVGKKVAEMGMKTVDVLMRGIGQGRESAVRGLANAGLIVQSITDTTRIPHNGCRPKKVRRVYNIIIYLLAVVGVYVLVMHFATPTVCICIILFNFQIGNNLDVKIKKSADADFFYYRLHVPQRGLGDGT